MPQNSIRLNTNKEFLLKNIVATHWTYRITLCYQLSHGGFTAQITGFPNMVCTANHATEDLQHRILDFSNYCSLHCHMKMEERKDSDSAGNSLDTTNSFINCHACCHLFIKTNGSESWPRKVELMCAHSKNQKT